MSSDVERPDRDGGSRHLSAVADHVNHDCAVHGCPDDHLTVDDDLHYRDTVHYVYDGRPVTNVDFAAAHVYNIVDHLEQRLADDYRAINDHYRAAGRGCVLGGLLLPVIRGSLLPRRRRLRRSQR